MLSLNLNTLFHAFTLQSGSHLAKTTIIDMLERYNFIYLFINIFGHIRYGILKNVVWRNTPPPPPITRNNIFYV